MLYMRLSIMIALLQNELGYLTCPDHKDLLEVKANIKNTKKITKVTFQDYYENIATSIKGGWVREGPRVE